MLLTGWHIHYGLGILHVFCHCTIRQLQNPLITGSLDHSPLKLGRMVWQQTGQWARTLSRYPVWALLPWSNLSLPALHDITSLTLPQSPPFGDMQRTPCTRCPCRPTAGFVCMVTVPSHCAANEQEMFQPFHNTLTFCAALDLNNEAYLLVARAGSSYRFNLLICILEITCKVQKFILRHKNMTRDQETSTGKQCWLRRGLC